MIQCVYIILHTCTYAQVRRERTVFMLRATLNRVTGYRSSHKGISMQVCSVCGVAMGGVV
jgi:hypothetical protein